MHINRLGVAAMLLLGACQQQGSSASAPAPVTNDDQQVVAKIVATDYAQRYSADACVAPRTTGRKGPQEISPTAEKNGPTWTYPARSSNNEYQMVSPGVATMLSKAWEQARSGDYPAITLSDMPQPASCAKTLTLTSPMVVQDLAFVGWSDGTNRRTVVAQKKASGWVVVAEGPARIG